MTDRLLKITSFFLLAAAVAVAPAQAQKIGYTNQQAILSNMPEMQDVQQKLQQEFKQQQKRFQQKQQQLQKQIQQYQQQRSMLNDSARAERERELTQQQQELQQWRQKRQQRIRQREQELMQPLLKNLQSAINLVANRRDVDMVVQSQALLYVNQSSDQVVDITQEVAEELEINLEQAPSEPSPTVDPPTTTPPPGGGGGQ